HATDPLDGPLPASALSWTIVLHHNTHTHPFLDGATGNGIHFTAPPPEDLAAVRTSYLEIRLTATNSHGLSVTVVKNFQPKIVVLTFKTQPAGLRIGINEGSFTGPSPVPSWAGFVLNVSAADQGSHRFRSWSDGGARNHAITTPRAAATYTARF